MTTYGRIAQHALVVHSSEADRLPTKKVADANSTYWFAYYNNSWCLYSIDTTLERYSNTIMMLPTLTEIGTELTYRILRNALKSAPQYLMIPDCVLSIDSNSQNRLSANSVTVYYEGTEQEWNKLMSEGYGVDVRFYVDCVHNSDNEWTYVNGTVSTVIHTITQQVKKKATCVEEGILLHECSACKETWETVIGLTDHTFDENYACTVCDKAAIKVTLNTIGTLSGFENDSTNPFTIDQEGVIQTGSVAQIYSQMILTADRTMRIVFDYRIENGKNTDRWYIYLNNMTQENMPGTESASRHFEIVLNEGDVLRIRFRNGGGTSSITGIGFIENFYIL
jgi:hypothetical protein